MNGRILSFLLALAVSVLFSCGTDNAIKTVGKGHFYSSRGISYFEQGEYDQAISDLNKAIKSQPDHHMAYCYRGRIYSLQNKLDLALSDFNKAIDIFPLAHYYNGRGMIYMKRRQYDLGIKEYIKAVRLDPDYAEAYTNLARLLSTCSEEKYRDGLNAVKYAKKAIEFGLKSSRLDTLAAAYAEVGDFENAIKTQEEAIQLLKEEDNLDPLVRYKKRLESYKKHMPWTEM